MNAFQFGQMVKAALGPAQAGMAENIPPGYLDVEPQFKDLVADGRLNNSLTMTPAGRDRLNSHRVNGIGGNNNADIYVNERNNYARRLFNGYQAWNDSPEKQPPLQYGDSRSFAPGAPRGTGSSARAAAPQLPKPAAPAAAAPVNKSIFSAMPAAPKR